MHSVSDGLEGISVAKTTLSDVDGEKGHLVIRGYDVEEIAGKISFENVCGLLWSGTINFEEEQKVKERLAKARERAYEGLGTLGNALKLANGMDALRASLAQLETDKYKDLSDAELCTGATPVYAAAWYRYSVGQQPVSPDKNLSTSQDYYRMIFGNAPEKPRYEGIDTYLVTISDHGMNASTFTTRVIGSTASDLISSVVGAVGALKGPLHGGAPGPVLDMLDSIGKPENAEAWIENELKSGQRIMGMGHRIYRVRDPRAAVMERAVEKLEKAGITTNRLALARAVEKTAQGSLGKKYPNRTLAANVEFYTAVLLDTIGIPRKLFSPTFAVGRMVGWCAHYFEQQKNGRLIRPLSEYTGPRDLKL
jgi:citrate synthase